MMIRRKMRISQDANFSDKDVDRWAFQFETHLKGKTNLYFCSIGITLYFQDPSSMFFWEEKWKKFVERNLRWGLVVFLCKVFYIFLQPSLPLFENGHNPNAFKFLPKHCFCPTFSRTCNPWKLEQFFMENFPEQQQFKSQIPRPRIIIISDFNWDLLYKCCQ